MKKLAYLECPTGLAGDMCLGALVDAGVPLNYLIDKLKLLGISEEYRLWTEQVQRNGQRATKVHVELVAAVNLPTQSNLEVGVDPVPTFDRTRFSMISPRSSDPGSHSHDTHSRGSHSHDAHGHGDRPHDSTNPAHGTRHLPEIEAMIRAAGLPARAEAWSLAVFRQLAEAEGAVHGIPADQVHFHEVGATDAIADIVGTCLGLDWLGIDQLYCSPLPTGGGTIRAAHGRLPVPAPAVLKLWEMRQVPIYSNGIERELVTPTGAAIATTLAVQFGAPPTMMLQRVGLGAGSRDLPIPNILRLWLGEGPGTTEETKLTFHTNPSPEAPLSHSPTSTLPSQQSIAVLETQIDDLNPQAIGYIFDALFAVGAVDVFTQAIGMKKSRPGILLTVICHPERVQQCEAVIFRETTTLGIRHAVQQRSILHREMQTVQTTLGEIRVKVAWGEGGAIANVQPEYEDCAALAKKHTVPWREVHQLALTTWQQSKN
ncbi:nickel pincer cofactor biosynthesis protein LarC [Leptolyngbya sp. FACHB-541]|uniref:nickel pincer cofactor biosynthesis protein LarC n=1 Tax=Leptolyngbya sp. FACHB-541 TaxID=2692810 RepID=UPI0016838EB6|nr:nickel pincer cofactor biosynthesis protein LarC [Leptolyngbya sp. FACHB-541]MBD1996608.1 nickel pincer cofactor biosynthesis protein LarC [Leptolyngbya sp. FACHB-541]